MIEHRGVSWVHPAELAYLCAEGAIESPLETITIDQISLRIRAADEKGPWDVAAEIARQKNYDFVYCSSGECAEGGGNIKVEFYRLNF